MTLVFMLSDHDEYGAENISITLDRLLLHKMIIKQWGIGRSIEQRMLADVLEKDDESIVGNYYLSRGWGGIHLDVVNLTEMSDVDDICDDYIPSHDEIRDQLQREKTEYEERIKNRQLLEKNERNTPDPALEGLVYDPNIYQWVKPS